MFSRELNNAKTVKRMVDFLGHHLRIMKKIILILAAPAGTTGWFLPSAQQWVKMMTGLGGLKASDINKWYDWFDQSHTAVDNWEAAFKKAGSGNYDSMIPHLCYWSSSEYSDDGAFGLYVDAAGPVGDCGFYWSRNYKDRRFDDYRVRPVLAF